MYRKNTAVNQQFRCTVGHMDWNWNWLKPMTSTGRRKVGDKQLRSSGDQQVDDKATKVAGRTDDNKTKVTGGRESNTYA